MSPSGPARRPPRAAAESAPEGDPLLEAVAEEGRSRQVELIEAAQERAAERLREAERAVRDGERRAAALGAEEGEREARRRVALARIETSKALLAERERLVERALGLARDRFAAWLEEREGAAWLAGAVRTAARALALERVRVRVRPAARSALAAALGKGPPAIDWEDADDGTRGAVVLAPDGRRAVDMTVDAILHRRGEAARRAAATALFESEARA